MGSSGGSFPEGFYLTLHSQTCSGPSIPTHPARPPSLPPPLPFPLRVQVEHSELGCLSDLFQQKLGVEEFSLRAAIATDIAIGCRYLHGVGPERRRCPRCPRATVLWPPLRCCFLTAP